MVFISENMISIIIPVYNVEKYIHVCINSILKQSYTNFEIICIDDASTDSTLEILNYFAKKDSRVKIFKNEYNKGAGYCRNRGLDIAKGKYILFLDGDDWFSLNALEVLINQSEKNNLDILIFKCIVYYNDFRYFGIEKYYEMEFLTQFNHKIFNHWDVEKRKLFSIPTPVWNKLYLKSFLDKNNITFTNENYIFEDNPFSIKSIIHANRISISNNYFYNRRRRPDSVMTLTDNKIFDILHIVILILEVFLDNAEIYEYYKNQLLNYIFSSILTRKYHEIDEEYKKQFFYGVQGVYKKLLKDYGLYEDIINNVDEDVLKFFKFEEILKDNF